MSAVPTRMRLNKEISAELRARVERVFAAAAGAGGQHGHGAKAGDMLMGPLDTGTRSAALLFPNSEQRTAKRLQRPLPRLM